MAFCISCGAQLPEGAGFCNHCGTAQNAGGQQAAPQMQPQFQAAPQMQAQAQAQPPQKQGRTGLIIGLVLGGTALVAGVVVLILFLTGVFGGKEYRVFLGGKEYGKYKAGSEVTVQQAVPKGADMSFSSEDVTLSRDEKNGMYLISFVMPEKDVTIHVDKTAVVYPVPGPTPQPGPDPVDPKPVDPTALSGEMIRWGVTYFGLQLPVEWDNTMVTDFSKDIHEAPNYMEQVLNIEDVNWITLSPCTDQEIITRLETGFELVGILTLPSGYPLYLTMEIDADPSTETGAWILEHREELIDSINASEGALLEKDVVYTGGPMIDMTDLRGIWSSEGGGMRTLTILPDATFRLHSYDFQGGEGKEEPGYLVFDNGVCHVYDESGYPWGGMTGDTYLERNDDGTITWHEGNGAERFVPTADGDNHDLDDEE
ncbi:MAG: zinc ribbon domain-containing protein [Lachnospiraceae bacterium]|nr:zinc ribbon domain-containing protein [Lachnospiraceae bacterium]